MRCLPSIINVTCCKAYQRIHLIAITLLRTRHRYHNGARKMSILPEHLRKVKPKRRKSEESSNFSPISFPVPLIIQIRELPLRDRKLLRSHERPLSGSPSPDYVSKSYSAVSRCSTRRVTPRINLSLSCMNPLTSPSSIHMQASFLQLSVASLKRSA